MNCACGSGKDFEACCGPYLSGESLAPTAEALMRSRYTAYTRGDIAYIKKTLAPEGLKDFDSALAKKWATQSVWKGLEIISTDKGTSEDRKGVVEFMASYVQDGKAYDHHEVSRFRKNDKGEWLFVDGDSHVHKEGEDHHHHHHTVQQTVVRESAKVGRNDPCPCGSGKKYKKCCGVNA